MTDEQRELVDLQIEEIKVSIGNYTVDRIPELFDLSADIDMFDKMLGKVEDGTATPIEKSAVAAMVAEAEVEEKEFIEVAKSTNVILKEIIDGKLKELIN